jgi:hypothetical protein
VAREVEMVRRRRGMFLVVVRRIRLRWIWAWLCWLLLSSLWSCRTSMLCKGESVWFCIIDAATTIAFRPLSSFLMCNPLHRIRSTVGDFRFATSRYNEICVTPQRLDSLIFSAKQRSGLSAQPSMIKLQGTHADRCVAVDYFRKVIGQTTFSGTSSNEPIRLGQTRCATQT